MLEPQTKPTRRERRLLLRRGVTKDQRMYYADNKGTEYESRFVAKCSSLYNIVMGCFKNGFPIVVKRLWYPSWAFYPFIFIRRDAGMENPTELLVHEGIHIRQQRDLHIVFSIPLLVLSFWVPEVLFIIPFVPSLFYMMEYLRCDFKYRPLPRREVRKKTCFEREANENCTNKEYLLFRRWFAFLHYVKD